MSKRIAVCSDGTWSRPDQRCPTNVVKMARAIAPKAPDGKLQVVFYDEGVGTGNLLDRLTGGAFGGGLEKNISDAYHFLMHNYDEGDDIYLFGFSRGAYTVRSLAGLIRNSGLLRNVHAAKFPEAYSLYRRKDAHPNSEEAEQFRQAYSREVEIWCLGVWDTVGALGVPAGGIRFLSKGRYEFHDVELSRYVRHGYHALGIDEKRMPFKPTLWADKPKEGQEVEQVWFVGVHSDIGGGYTESGLSDITFLWMKGKAGLCGLAFDDGYVGDIISPDPAGILHNSMTPLYWVLGTFTRRPGQGGANQAVHPAVMTRYSDDKLRYRPENLVAYLENSDHRIASLTRSD